MNLTALKQKLQEIANKGLFKDASWLLIARLINVVVQAAYFIIVARALGADNYGSFLAVTSVASLLFPFIALGTDNVLVKEVSVKRSLFSSYWGNSLLVLVFNSIVIIGILLLFATLIFPNDIPLLTIAFLLIADLFFLGLLEATNKAFRAINLMHKTAQMIVFNTCGKLLAALCLLAFFNNLNAIDNNLINIWAGLYCTSSIFIGFLAVLTVSKMAGKPTLNLSRIRSDINQGIHFAIGMSANNINTNIDKWMLAKIVTTQATGVYGSAYRFISIGEVPIAALFNATYPRFFQHGSQGIRNCFKFAKKLLPVIIGYGVISFIGYQIFAPLIPKILGAEYQDTVSTLRWLAPLPAITSLQLVAADTLTGSGYQKIRSIVQVIAAVFNVALNIWLIPLYGLSGAIWATLTSDGFKLICLWSILFFIYNFRSQPQTSEENL